MDEQRLDVAIIFMPYGFSITPISWKGKGILQSSWEILFTQAISQTQRTQPSNDSAYATSRVGPWWNLTLSRCWQDVTEM